MYLISIFPVGRNANVTAGASASPLTMRWNIKDSKTERQDELKSLILSKAAYF